MADRRRLLAPALALVVLLATGCATSNWRFIHQLPPGKAVTKVTVRTQPEKAAISLNGHYIGESPLEVPIRYPFHKRRYERRDAFPYPHVEARDVTSYYANVFEIEAYKAGYHRGMRKVTLNGEKTMALILVLHPKPLPHQGAVRK